MKLLHFSTEWVFKDTISGVQCLYKVIHVCLKTCCSCVYLCLRAIGRAKFCVSINMARAKQSMCSQEQETEEKESFGESVVTLQ